MIYVIFPKNDSLFHNEMKICKICRYYYIL
jgi:hypothetical protein